MRRRTKRFFKVLGVILITLGVLNVIPPKKVLEDNPFIVKDGNLPMVAAHRGGKYTAPENTLKAYKYAVGENVKAEILETDLWLTKDGELVLNHDSTINRTSDVEILKNSTEKFYVRDFTLSELQEFNFGYKYSAKDGTTPYKDLVNIDTPNRKDIIKENDVGITTIDDLFETFYESHPNLLFIVEIKNSNEEGYKACDKLNEVLNKYPNYKDQITIGTFNSEIEVYLKDKYPSLLRGASTSVAAKFVVTQLLKVNIFDDSDVACLQLPMEMYGIDLTWDTYIKRAHRRNMAVQYWTINDEKDMRYLIEKGCDAIMSDDPELLRQVIDSYK